jgi:UDP-2,3-diacylglucosamine pyrophosphatase LpxH
MNNSNLNVPIYVTGDSHGNWDALFRKIEHYDIEDCIFIGLGDSGVGFISHDKQMRQFIQLNNRFKKRDIQYMTIRGNHDHKLYFKGIDRVVLSHMELLDDYTYKIINDQKFLFVGGAISVDRMYRKEGISYWKDEVFVLDESKIEQCDVLITHSAPNWIGPVDKQNIASFCAKDATLWDECVAERLAHNRLFEIAKPKYSYHGHFHVNDTRIVDGCKAMIIEELGIVEHWV